MSNPFTVEYCFVVTAGLGKGDVRVRSNGDVVYMGGGDNSILSLEGISFPTEAPKAVEFPAHFVAKQNNVRDRMMSGSLLINHYTSASGLDAILSSGNFRLSPFEKLNDPYEEREWHFTIYSDCDPRPEPGFPLAFHEAAQRKKAEYKVGCFALDSPFPNTRLDEANGGWRHPRLWDHYADHHKGAVLVFNALTLARTMVMGSGGDQPLQGVVVNYDEHRTSAFYKHNISYSEILTLGEDASLDRHFQRSFTALMASKHPDWRSEDEFRLIYRSPGNTDYVAFPYQDSLQEIIFGERFCPQEAERLLEKVNLLQHPVKTNVCTWRNGSAFMCPAADFFSRKLRRT